MWPVMTATRATVKPPTPGTMWAKNEPMPATRLITAIELVLDPGSAVSSGGPGGTAVLGALTWPVGAGGVGEVGGSMLIVRCRLSARDRASCGLELRPRSQAAAV